MKKYIILLISFIFLLCSCNSKSINTSIINNTEQPQHTEIIETEIEEETAPEVEEETTPEIEVEENKKEYVLNTNSYKIHKPDCYSVQMMKESNKEFVIDTVENLINKGYSRCGNCYPT